MWVSRGEAWRGKSVQLKWRHPPAFLPWLDGSLPLVLQGTSRSVGQNTASALARREMGWEFVGDKPQKPAPIGPAVGAILKLPIWGDPADENCFEDDIYWEVRPGGGGRHKMALPPSS